MLNWVSVEGSVMLNKVFGTAAPLLLVLAAVGTRALGVT